MRLLYDIGIRLYALAVRIAAPFNEKANLWLSGRKGVLQRMQIDFQGNKDAIIWMHVSSLGEFEQGRPLIEAIKEKYPQKKLLLTFFSPSGYEIRKNYEKADSIYYLPIDTQKNAQKFFDTVQPEMVFFVKYDFWYHYLHEAYKRNTPTYLISALFRKEQLFFKPYGGFYRRILKFFTTIFVQDKDSASLLKTIGVESVEVVGDTRVDRVVTLAETVQSIPYIDNFKKEKNLLIAGSTWQPDEELLIRYMETHAPKGYKVIFAPHEVHEAHIKQLEKRLGSIASVRYSQVDEATDFTEIPVLIIDSIGKLSSLYQYGDVAYIGGGFGAGIHNTLEPAAFGLPIIFGAKYKKFQEAVFLTEQGGAFSVSDSVELTKKLQQLLEDEDYRKKGGNIAKVFINQQKGSTQKILFNCLW